MLVNNIINGLSATAIGATLGGACDSCQVKYRPVFDRVNAMIYKQSYCNYPCSSVSSEIVYHQGRSNAVPINVVKQCGCARIAKKEFGPF
ncbi:unnamed protein product [Oikopleura dioica]|uniref:Uncharacterized protein n=1 Tax=Oikopleura dioica TaxID=34765 RepID=E4XNF8_OIKDI|nr:unnamed protein product [Oikopleura dioica]CBY41850.1 unnamed protein product [Oikopleura dioica]